MTFFKLILSLYDYSGEWSRPYREDGGYIVEQYDIGLNPEHDVRLLTRPSMPVHGILAAPPCTVFANSGAWVPRSKDEMIDGLSMVDAVLRLVTICRPRFWALENPTGKLQDYLGEPALWFNPFDYGDPYTKRTGLWGSFKRPVKTPCRPTDGSKITKKLGSNQVRQRNRTPSGFAKAFFLANR